MPCGALPDLVSILVNETLFSKLFYSCRVVPKMLEHNFSKNIHKASQASHTKIVSIRWICINTKQFLCFLTWYCIGTTLTIFDMHSDFRFAFLMGHYKAASVEQEAASAVASVGT